MTPGPSGSAEAVPTWSVGELHEAVGVVLTHAFGEQVWVEGELANLSRSSHGHVFFDLVEPDRDGDTGRPSLSVTLFNSDRLEVNRYLRDQGGSVRMRDGVRLRIRGRLNVYGARSTLQLVMSWIDPTFTLGVLGEQRERVLASLAADDLLGRNASVPMSELPLRVALVTSSGSAAHADALDELRRSGIGFHVTLLDARTQGGDAIRSITAAISVACRGDHDVVLVVRGGGARTDLVAFDDEAVCRAIATATVPVLTGIGHEVDRTVADEVAHHAHKTPTAAAAAVASVAVACRARVHDAGVQVATATRGRLRRSAHAVEELSGRAGRRAIAGIERSQDRLDHLRTRAAAAAPRRLEAADVQLDAARRRVSGAARRSTATAEQLLDGIAARARAHDPSLTLARGWSITRRADGSILRDADDAIDGERLVTTTAGGTVVSVVDRDEEDRR